MTRESTTKKNAKKKNTHNKWRLARKKVNCGTLKKRRRFGNKAKDSGEGAVTAYKHLGMYCGEFHLASNVGITNDAKVVIVGH